MLRARGFTLPMPLLVHRRVVQCGGESDDCDEDEAIVYLEWVPPAFVDW